MSDADWDEDDWELDGGEAGPAGAAPADLVRGVPYGFLVAVPLLLGYELSQTLVEGAPRSTAAVLALRALEPLGDGATWARRLLVVGLGVAALVACARRHWALGPAWLRTLAEGAALALVLGPLAIAVQGVLPEGWGPLPLPSGPTQAPALESALFVTGAAAYEELLFRLLVTAALVVLTRPLARFLGVPEGALGRVTLSVAVGLQSLLYAAAHLSAVAGPLGAGGEAFQAATFAFRTLGGLLYGVVALWRGLGVAVWTHAFTNLALLLGSGLEVFR